MLVEDAGIMTTERFSGKKCELTKGAAAENQDT